MTCIVVYKSKVDNCIYLASDTQISSWRKHEGCEKILKKSEDFYIGVCGNVSIQRVLHNWWTPIMEGKMSRKEIIDFVMGEVISNLLRYLDENKVAEVDKNVVSMEGNILIVYKGIMFSVDGMGGCSVIKDFYTTGSGASLALGYLEAVHNSKILDIEKVSGAIKCAGKYDLYCNQNVNMVKIQIVDGKSVNSNK
jgi:ATP-dependent protease HslVU (ClpYQ) peptidase subunit